MCNIVHVTNLYDNFHLYPQYPVQVVQVKHAQLTTDPPVNSTVFSASSLSALIQNNIEELLLSHYSNLVYILFEERTKPPRRALAYYYNRNSSSLIAELMQLLNVCWYASLPLFEIEAFLMQRSRREYVPILFWPIGSHFEGLSCSISHN